MPLATLTAFQRELLFEFEAELVEKGKEAGRNGDKALEKDYMLLAIEIGASARSRGWVDTDAN